MSDNGNDLATFLAGFIVGGLVGAATALLLAPQAGEDTREVIREKSIELKDKAVSTADETRVRAEKALEEARLRADEKFEDVRVRAGDLATKTKEKAAELQHRGQVVLEEQSISPAGTAGEEAAADDADLAEA